MQLWDTYDGCFCTELVSAFLLHVYEVSIWT